MGLHLPDMNGLPYTVNNGQKMAVFYTNNKLLKVVMRCSNKSQLARQNVEVQEHGIFRNATCFMQKASNMERWEGFE